MPWCAPNTRGDGGARPGAQREARIAEVGFYHLTETPLEAVLPVMLQRSLERGWRVELRVGAPAVLDLLDERLWTWRDQVFLPHGRAGEPHEARQPILLSTAPEPDPSRAALFLVAGAGFDAAEAAERTRTALVFDAGDEAAVAAARDAWRAAVAAGLTATYWAQEPGGRWAKRQESGGT